MPPKIKKYLPWVLIALALGIGALLLRSSLRARPAASEDPHARVRGPNNLRIAMVSHRGDELISLAYESGLFENEGLLIDLVLAPTQTKALADLTKQEIDLAVLSDIPLGLQAPSGADIGVLAVIADMRQDMLVVAQKSSGINKAADLKGKRLGIEGNDAQRYLVDLFLAHNKLSQETVNVVPLSIKYLASSLRGGEVAAIADAFGYYHGSVQSLTKPTEAAMTNFKDRGYVRFQYCLAAPRAIIDKKRPLLEKTMRALLAASDKMKKDRKGSAEFVAKVERVPAKKVLPRWKGQKFSVTLGKPLLTSLEAQSTWKQRQQDAGADGGVVDWMGLMAPEILRELRPEAVKLGN